MIFHQSTPLGTRFRIQRRSCFSIYPKASQTKHSLYPLALRGGGGQDFFRDIISFGLGPPEVAPYMTGTFGKVFGPRNHTGSEPRPARK